MTRVPQSTHAHTYTVLGVSCVRARRHTRARVCVQLLSRIAGAASAEELRKVQAEIEAALGITEVQDEDAAEDATTAATSGLTPNVAEMHVGSSKHV